MFVVRGRMLGWGGIRKCEGVLKKEGMSFS